MSKHKDHSVKTAIYSHSADLLSFSTMVLTYCPLKMPQKPRCPPLNALVRCHIHGCRWPDQCECDTTRFVARYIQYIAYGRCRNVTAYIFILVTGIKDASDTSGIDSLCVSLFRLTGTCNTHNPVPMTLFRILWQPCSNPPMFLPLFSLQASTRPSAGGCTLKGS